MTTATTVGLFYQLSILFLSFPLHIYWLLEWKKHQHHFVLLRRFPKISIVAFIIAFVVQISMIIYTIIGVDKTKQLGLNAIAMSLTFVQEGLIFYRVHLLYVRYTITCSYLTTMMQSDSSTDKITINRPKVYKYHGLLSNTMLIFIIIGAVGAGITVYTATMNAMALFLVLILMGIIIVLNTLRAKVKESIACVQESAWTISVTLLVMTLEGTLAILFKTPESVAVFRYCAGFTLHTLIATAVLYIPLHLLNKAGSDAASPREFAEVSTKQSQSSLDHDEKHDTDLEVNSSTHSNDIVRLHTFLQSHQNYKVFAAYLSRCFALESLLFCERVLILYHIILKYKQMDTEFVKYKKTDAYDDDIPTNKLYALKLDYLSDIYIEMDSAVQNEASTNNENANMKYKKGILSIIRLIYKQFCCDDSPTQINVPYEIYAALHEQLKFEKDETAISDQFASYDKLLRIFDNALQEAWEVCESVYSFRFQIYIAKQSNLSKLSHIN